MSKLDSQPLSYSETVKEIAAINTQILEFWKNPGGWAPPRAAQILSVSRLDWQVSLSHTLWIWLDKMKSGLTPGELILAWANLGSLVEGTMKTMLAVYYEDYINDTHNIKKAGAFNTKKNVPKSPQSLSLEQLRIYFREQKLLTDAELSYVEKIQRNRNVLHAFQDAPLGDVKDFGKSVILYCSFLKKINGLLPYPDNY